MNPKWDDAIEELLIAYYFDTAFDLHLLKGTRVACRLGVVLQGRSAVDTSGSRRAGDRGMAPASFREHCARRGWRPRPVQVKGSSGDRVSSTFSGYQEP